MSIMSASLSLAQVGGLNSGCSLPLQQMHRVGNTSSGARHMIVRPSTAIRRNLVRCMAGDSDPPTKLRETVDNKREVVDKNIKDGRCTEEIKFVGEVVNHKLEHKREVVDENTKEDLTKDILLRNQNENSSEKGSVFGAIHSFSSFFARPEIERRPETGENSFGSLFYFDGAAPETINGRLAMLGFVWGLAVEKATGLTVMEQVSNPSVFGLVSFVGVAQLFTFASLVPLMMGESTDARHFGIFNAKAERWNGRLAMLGFAALLIDEAISGSPFISALQNWLPGL